MSIASIEFSLNTDKKILAQSAGEITEIDDVKKITNTEEFSPSPHGLYSEEIFGVSKINIKKEVTLNPTAIDQRRFTLAHIELPVPYLNPDLYKQGKGGYVAKLLGIDKISLVEKILNWEYSLVSFKPELYEDKNSQILRKLRDSAKPSTKTPELNKNMPIRLELLDSRGNTFSPDNEYYLLPATMFTSDSVKDVPKLRDLWKYSVYMVNGVYAIAHLLNRVDVKTELDYCERMIKEITLKSLEGEISNKERGILERLSDKQGILVGLMKQKIKVNEILNKCILVLPAGHRDVSIMTDSQGNTTKSEDAFNNFYKRLLVSRKSLRNIVSKKGIPYEKLDISSMEILSKHTPSEQRFGAECKNIQETLFEMHSKGQAATDKNQPASLAQKTGGKTAIPRDKMMGKRLDDTGRSTITVDPLMPFNKIGVPFLIAIKWLEEELLTTIKENFDNASDIEKAIKLMKSSLTSNIYLSTNRGTDKEVVFGSVKELTKDVSVDTTVYNIVHENLDKLLNKYLTIAIRFPTLHKFNVQGFEMTLVYDKSIKLHPLVCAAYNADFDGDQMALVLMKTEGAHKDMREFMFPIKNTLDANGTPLMVPTQDSILGLYYISSLPVARPYGEEAEKLKETKYFKSPEELLNANSLGHISLTEWVWVDNPRYDQSMFEDSYKEYQLATNVVTNIKYTDPTQTASTLRKLQNQSRIDLDNNHIQNKKKFLKEDYLKNEKMEISPRTFIVEKQKVLALNTSMFEQKETQPILTTAGLILLNTVVPQDLGIKDRTKDLFSLEVDENYIMKLAGNEANGLIDKGVEDIIKRTINKYDERKQAFVFDAIKHLGYKSATRSGISLSLYDIKINPKRDIILAEAKKEVSEIENEYKLGNISLKDKSDRIIDVWTKAGDRITEVTVKELGPTNPLKVMSVSGARGNKSQLTQLMGIKGLLKDSGGKTIETPVLRSFDEGLQPLDFFTSSYGGRKGIVDRSSNTRSTGHASRVMIYGTEHYYITMGDCGDTEGFEYTELKDGYTEDGMDVENPTVGESLYMTLFQRVVGKLSAQEVKDSDGNTVLKYNQLITEKHEDIINELPSLRVRSVLSCKAHKGICAKCYGMFHTRNRFAQEGDPIGIVASQTFGERGSQLTMRTFHTGGIAKGDITAGFSAVKKVLESNKNIASLKPYRELTVDKNDFDVSRSKTIELGKKSLKKMEPVDFIKKIKKDGLTWEDFGLIKSRDYILIQKVLINYLVRVYFSNDIRNVAHVHYETMIRSLTSSLKVVDAGSSTKQVGSSITPEDLIATNLGLLAKGVEPVLARPYFTTLKDKMKDINRPLAAITSENVVQVATRAAMFAAEDDMTSVLSNMAVSNTIPTGSGFDEHRDKLMKISEPVLMQDLLEEYLNTVHEDIVTADSEEFEEVIIEKVELPNNDMSWDSGFTSEFSTEPKDDFILIEEEQENTSDEPIKSTISLDELKW